MRDLLGLLEEVGLEAFVGVEHFDADEAVVFPVVRDEAVDAGRERGRGMPTALTELITLGRTLSRRGGARRAS
ncbi:MAG: hypothetical protein ABIP57_14470 [Jatrophihabitantaceae bacterium]